MLDLKWTPQIGPPAIVEIPIVYLGCASDAQAQWRKAQERWHRTNKCEPQWDTYFKLIESGGIRVKSGGQVGYGFPEIHTVVHLAQQGFKWWTTVQLFNYGTRNISDHRRRKTEEVKREWKRTLAAKWPADIQDRLEGPAPRNPDIVAYHPQRNEWRFCETKSWTDQVKEGQLVGLAVLHLLTKAPVAIVRIVPEGRSPKGEPLARAMLRYREEADLKWVQASA
jgi:hypothetical protein